MVEVDERRPGGTETDLGLREPAMRHAVVMEPAESHPQRVQLVVGDVVGGEVPETCSAGVEGHEHDVAALVLPALDQLGYLHTGTFGDEQREGFGFLLLVDAPTVPPGAHPAVDVNNDRGHN